MISDHHRGLLNGPKEHLESYPPIVHMWYIHHFTTKIWKKQCNKEVIGRLKVLCKVKEEKKFEARLEELEKILNNDAKVWSLSNCPKTKNGHMLLMRVVVDMGL
jgi:hypothetical protein